MRTGKRPGIDDKYVLCWSCHFGLLHAGIIAIEEVQAAAADADSNVTHDEVYRDIKSDLDEAGERSNGASTPAAPNRSLTRRD